MTCGVQQGSILGLLLFLILENDLSQAPNILYSIMFPDNTKRFCCHHLIKVLFEAVNCDFEKMNQ